VSSTIKDGPKGFSDYYEILQLSPNADGETVGRVYRMLAKRYHPDNTEGGNAEKFGIISEAYRVLSDPEKRAAYDVAYEKNRAATLKIFDETTSSGNNFVSDERIFETILSLLYIARRRVPRRGGMGIMQLEKLLGCPGEHLEFHVWYLREKGWIERLDTGQLSITASGVDRVIENDRLELPADRLLVERNPDPQSEPQTDPSNRLKRGAYALPFSVD
jgi:curved DNA-binding protein